MEALFGIRSSMGETAMERKDELDRIVELLLLGKFVLYQPFNILDEDGEIEDLGFTVISTHETLEGANEALSHAPKESLRDIVGPADLCGWKPDSCVVE